MLFKWKQILINWINCYFNEATKNVESVDLESLITIISHLRENLNLDETKSSVLEAHTVEEFIVEKYPEFKFENDSYEVVSEENLCVGASLLLFFVCVNSKNVNIKNAMCSKLSAGDQEIILKFSKSLMECSEIRLRDVYAAIAEACGQDQAMENGNNVITVAETPPALRSLHGEVRRLQAALDAEKFDRNFLQEELARTNLRVEKLLKDKEQYNLDIIALKTKISLCCGEEGEARAEAKGASEIGKLARQLQEAEERFVAVQNQLDEMVYERDTCKSKLKELKQERDKWLSLSQQESARVCQLTEELNSERCEVTSLRELVADLRMHNQRNCLDSSQLECDDPDASVHSMQHNLSVCSEICANVVEVQLGEERAKIVLLKQQINSLQDQLNELNQKYGDDKNTLEIIINEKDNVIFDLKHRINEEIEEKNILKTNFNDDIAKLNNEINELDQKLKNNNENARVVIETKMEEIKALQEEKLSLLHSFSEEFTKLENKIKGLQIEIDEEKQAKSNMKEGYENHIMKLNEKLLNRNNELVELQNNMLETSEMIESLHLNLRHERKHKDEIMDKYESDVKQLNEEKNSLENKLSHTSEELQELQRDLEDKSNIIEELSNSIDEFKATIVDLNENCSMLEETKGKLMNEIEIRDSKLEDLEKELSNIKINYRDEKEQLLYSLDERNASINSLHVQLQNEIHYKVLLQDELSQQHSSKTALTEEFNKLDSELLKLREVIQDKNNVIDDLDLFMQEERGKNEKLCLELNDLNAKIVNKDALIAKKDDAIKALEQKLEQFEEEIRKKNDIIMSLNKKITTTVAEKEILKSNLFSINEDKGVLEDDLAQKSQEIASLQAKCAKLSKTAEDNKSTMLSLEQKLRKEMQKYEELENNNEKKTSKMIVKLNETERIIKEISVNSNKTIKNQELKIQTLNMQMEDLGKAINMEKENALTINREKEALLCKLDQESSYLSSIEKEYRNQFVHIDTVTAQLNLEINDKNEKIKALTTQLETSLKAIDDKNEEYKNLEHRLTMESQALSEISQQKKMEAIKFQNRIKELESLSGELEQEMKNIIDSKSQVIQGLEKENEQLQFTIEEDNSNQEVLLKEKDAMIDLLGQQLKDTTTDLESIRKDYEDITLTTEKYKVVMRENLEMKEAHIANINAHIQVLEQNLIDSEKANEQMSAKIVEMSKTIEDLEEKEVLSLKEALHVEERRQAEFVTHIQLLEDKLADEQDLLNKIQMDKERLDEQYNVLVDTNNKLLEDKIILAQQLSEERSVRKIIEEEKRVVLLEKQKIDTEINQLIDDKECLTQQLLEEKSARHIAEKERDNDIAEKETLAQQICDNKAAEEDLLKQIKYLLHECSQANTSNNNLQDENELLKEQLVDTRSIKDTLVKEKDALIVENETMKQDLLEKVAVNDTLMSEKELLMVEKESIQLSLSEEKAVRDGLESEKDSLKVKLNELVEQHKSNLNETRIELVNADAELKQLKRDYQEQLETSNNLSTAMCISLNKILQKLKAEDITNEVLLKLVSMENNGNMTAANRCDLLVNIADTLTTELSMRKNLEKALEHENTALEEMQKICERKDNRVMEQQTEIKELQQLVQENKIELSKRVEAYNAALEAKSRDIQSLQSENQSLHNDLTDVRIQLEVKVHSLNEKLIDNENLTDKLKRTYDCQIDNLNMMISKLTNYLRDKTVELETLRKEKERLQETVEQNNKTIKSIEEEVKAEKQKQEKMIEDFESERLVLKNMVTVTESVMEDQKVSLSKVINEHVKINETLQEECRNLKIQHTTEYEKLTTKFQEKESALQAIFAELTDARRCIDALKADKDNSNAEIHKVKSELECNQNELKTLEHENKRLTEILQQYEIDIKLLQDNTNELKIKHDETEVELQSRIEKLTKELHEITENNNKLQNMIEEKDKVIEETRLEVKQLKDEINVLVQKKNYLEHDRNECVTNLDEIKSKLESQLTAANDEATKLKEDNLRLVGVNEDNRKVITNLELKMKHELEQLRSAYDDDKQNLMRKCSLLEDYQAKAEVFLEERQKDIISLQAETKTLSATIDKYETIIKEKDSIISAIEKEKDGIISLINKELVDEKTVREKCQKELESVFEMRHDLEVKEELLKHLKMENEELVKAVGQRETFAALSQEKSGHKYPREPNSEPRDHQVDTTQDTSHSSVDSHKTISDLEKIIHDKNRTVTTLQSDITYIKTLMAESEYKLLDVTKELDNSKENCQQLSTQLKKIVYQKNEEIAELKRQVVKMSATENRASQIIKVSAKYQAIILMRIAEIKTNTVLKELTNFGNCNTSDSELRRGLNAGTITMEDLENFLETTDKHLKRCAEKQAALQKERDRLTEVNRINESEIINLQKFLTELSVSCQTFNSVKELYTQKLSRVISVQRTARREILNLDGRITDAAMCSLERGYAAVMQDLAECAMNLQRWVERCISRAISPEKIKQAFTSDTERVSLASNSFQNAGLEVQLEELESSFQKLLEEIARAQKGEGAKDAQALTVMEVRAEYEDKLNRMKAKMKQLYQEQISVFMEKQRVEVAVLERELQKSRARLAESSRKYEEHIRALTTELWSVGEKFLMKKDEAEWLRRKHKSGSLMSLQHVHSSGLVPPQDEPPRPSDSHSLRSLPMATNASSKREGRGLHMSDEEGEVFDNRWLQELAATPRRAPPLPGAPPAAPAAPSAPAPGLRLSELRFRNSLCPPHLKSSYPAEMQFAPALDEEDIKCVTTGSMGGRQQRKEVGITAYKKPGPPTPSKQAGRLSATDSELRESLRVEADPLPGRKTSTPSRIRSLFRSNKNDTTEGTPRSRRLSNIFRKK